MGEMADFANDYQCETMQEYWDYQTGAVSLAPEEQLPELHNDFDLPISFEDHQREIQITSARLSTSPVREMYAPWKGFAAVPTCNCCRDAMQPREGKFGKFYYCANGCADQKAVSDSYWQSYLNKQSKGKF
jgi:hypothetical protein